MTTATGSVHDQTSTSTPISRRALIQGAACAGIALAAAGIASGAIAPQASAAGGSTSRFVYGTTNYGLENADTGLDPHNSYSGWSTVRYGVGETLFKFSDAMEPEPWLAVGYKYLDEATVRIDLRDGVYFTNGRPLDGAAVKECLEDLIAVHDRAPEDLNIASIEADDLSVTIHTNDLCPSLINYLCDPYGAIIDMQSGVTDDDNVVGTGPYVAVSVSDSEIELVKNESYWGEVAPQVDEITVRAITNGDTLTMALQTGEVDATYGLPYASYVLFDNANYTISSCNTSRTFFLRMNMASDIMQDKAVRDGIARGIDRQGFVTVLLNGYGDPAMGAFPANYSFGADMVSAPEYDPESAQEILEDAGWIDTDGDGIREKDGTKLTLRWLTYPSRQELPLLAEYAQATLKEIGIDVEVDVTANHRTIVTGPDWDIYAAAMVLAPTGDPAYFFTSCCLDNSVANYGGYHSDELEVLAQQLHDEFDPEERSDLAIRMQQIIIDDAVYVFVSYLRMGIVSQAKVSGMVAHPSDYYEITAELEVKA